MARPEIEPKTPLAQRLRAFRKKIGDPDRDVVAAKIGVSKSAFASYERGETEPSASALLAYQEEFGANILWLLTGEGEMLHADLNRVSKAVTVEPVTIEHLVQTLGQMSHDIATMKQNMAPISRLRPQPVPTIKYLPLQASAGGGAVVLEETDGIDMDIDMVAENLLGIRRKNIIMLEIKGDSMEPTLHDKDVVIVDSSDPKPNDDPDENKVYVVSIEGDLFAKRARWTDSGGLLWCSDNERYTPISVTGEDFNRIKTVGRLAWVWRPV